MDRALASGAKGHKFESCRARHICAQYRMPGSRRPWHSLFSSSSTVPGSPWKHVCIRIFPGHIGNRFHSARSVLVKTPSAKSRFFPAGKKQTAGEAVLNTSQGQCWSRDTAGRKEGFAAGGFMRTAPGKSIPYCPLATSTRTKGMTP